MALHCPLPRPLRRPRVFHRTTRRTLTMSQQARLDALKDRHAALEARIFDEDQRPRPDSDTLMRLKIEKLHVKEEIERLRESAQIH
jgi:hypothetical protein